MCVAPGCIRAPRKRGRYCAACSMRIWRERNPKRAQKQEEDRQFSDTQTAERRARAYLATLIKRGKARRMPCAVCGEKETTPTWVDPQKKRAVKWYCSAHKSEVRLNRRAIRDAKDALARAIAAFDELQESERQRVNSAASGILTQRDTSRRAVRFAYWVTVASEIRKLKTRQTVDRATEMR